MDDNNSSIGNRMPQQQAAFRANLETLPFTFDTKCLDLPKTIAEGVETFDKDSIQSLCTADSSMGKELDAIFELIDGQAKQ